MFKNMFLLIIAATVMNFAQIFEPVIYVQKSEFDFGKIIQGKSVDYAFIVVNKGSDTLKIYDVRPSCGCTAAKLEKNMLAPGESTQIKVTFNSEGKIGKQDKFIAVNTNDPKMPSYQLKLTGYVEKEPVDLSKSPRINFQETSYNFGKIKESSKVNHTFKFKNIGATALEINDVKTTCDCITTVISNKKIEPGKEGTLKVEFDSKDRLGKITRSVQIYSNDPEEPIKVVAIYSEILKNEK